MIPGSQIVLTLLQMKNFTLRGAAAAATAGLLVLAACQKNNSDEVAPASVQNGDLIEGSYIVKYRGASLPSARRSHSGDYLQEVKAMETYTQSYLRRVGVEVAADEITQTYVGDFAGFAARLSGTEANRLRSRPEVEYVEQDRVWTLDFPDDVSIESEVQSVGVQNTQAAPWGITRVGGPVDMSTSSKRAWVIDTGIDTDHPDLNVDVPKSKEFVTFGRGSRTVEDGNGHGTHVAGTIGAKNNTVGVVGVAAGVKVVGVKVLSDGGSGSTSDIVAGCNYVANNGVAGDVANLSLGGGVSTAMDDAVRNIASKGIFTCLAAGNSAANANNSSPARANATNLFTVSAFAEGNGFASFSNFGNPPIDISEPGVNIRSTYSSGRYATLSGTSMASPHAAGILLVRGDGTFGNGGTVTGDKDSTPDIIGTL